MKSFFKNKWIVLIARVAVALVFILYAWGKIEIPREFVKDVNGYHLVPNDFLNLFSVLLPGIEIVAGVALLIGLFTRASATIILCLLIVFMGAFAGSSILGIEVFDCGCSGGENGNEAVNPVEFYARDLALLIGAIIALRGKHIFALDNLLSAKKA